MDTEQARRIREEIGRETTAERHAEAVRDLMDDPARIGDTDLQIALEPIRRFLLRLARIEPDCLDCGAMLPYCTCEPSPADDETGE